MVQWKKVRIQDIGTVVGGATPSTKIDANYKNGHVSWITPKDLSTFEGRYIYTGERNITEMGLNSSSTVLMPKNSILFSSRAPIGYVAIAGKELCTNQGFKSVIPNKKIDYLFLYYLLKYNKNKIENLGSGTTFKEVSGSVMKNVEVMIPEDIKEQKRIAAVLNSIDDKIELNNEINDNLCEQIKATYKRIINGSNNLKVTRIGDLPIYVTDYVANGSFASLKENVTLYQEPNYAYFIRNTDLKSGNFDVYVDEHSYNFLSKSALKGKEIIISNVGDVGSVFLCPMLNKPMTLGNNVIMIEPEDEKLRYYLYSLFKWFDGYNLIQGIKGGSAVPKFNKTDFKNIQINLPLEKELEEFNNFVSPYFEKLIQNQDANKHLSELRDSLLPKLMSGEIDVDSIEL